MGNYIITHLTVKENKENKHLENPGALALLDQLKGKKQGIPYWVIFDKKGKLLIGLLRIFNTKIGTIALAISLKILKTSFPKLIIYDEDELPSPDIKWIVNNFEKI